MEASRPRLPFLAAFLAAFLSSLLPAASAAALASPLSFLRRFTMGLHGRQKSGHGHALTDIPAYLITTGEASA